MISAYMGPLANHLWQSTLFATAAWLLTLTLRKNRAAVRHRLWLAASVKFLIPFSFLAGIGSHFEWRTASEAAPHPISIVVDAISQPFAAMGAAPALQPSRGPAVLLCVWICGFGASILWWSIRWRQVRRAVRRASPLNLDVPIRVMCCTERLEPGVFGIFTPVLLLPEGITDRLSAAQLQSVLAHELYHVRRRDNTVASIHMFVEALFWFHPMVWWIKVRLIEEQERACDEEVLRLGADPQVYAESILKICEFYLTSPLICVSGITGSELKRRIEEIMRNRAAVRLSLSRALLLAAATIAALAGPIVSGIANAKTGRAQSQPRSSEAQTAQLERPGTASTEIATKPQRGGIRGSFQPSGVIQEYRIGVIKVTGAKAFGEDQILLVLGLVSGEFFNENRLSKGFEDLKRLYGSRGYINFAPVPVMEFEERQKVLNLTINIDEDRQFVINRISFTGNTTTPDEVIRREMLVKEGDVFNTQLWDLSLLRLNRLGLFEQIKNDEDASIEPSRSEPKVDIVLKVKEKGR
jgi:beta-lactamase regulating signal transducer with metallopeptidase domain